MAWVRGLFVLLTISADAGVRMAVQPTTTPLSVAKSTVLNGLSTKQLDQPIGPQSIIPALPTTSAGTDRTPSPSAQKPFRKNAPNTNGRSSFESVLILSPSNAEEMYDKAMKHYDENGYTTRQMCAAWEKRGCQCSGTVEQLSLSCRAIGLNEKPTDLPSSLIKL